MSDETTTMDAKEFLENENAAKKLRMEQGKATGPTYTKHGQPARWFHQAFERDIAPTGTVDCSQGLRAGTTSGSLNVCLVASAKNEEAIVAASGATITCVLYNADKEDGEYTEVGPTICVKAPADGIKAEPGEALCKFAIGDLPKAWLKPKLTFEGTITPGTLDCILDIYPG